MLTIVDLTEPVGRPIFLSSGKHEGQDGDEEGVEDADHGEDVGPADLAVGDDVLVAVPAYVLHVRVAPAGRVDDTTQEHERRCRVEKH